MSQRDVLETRTSEVGLVPGQAPEARVHPPVSVLRSEAPTVSERTELLPLEANDTAVVSFARERERALRRSEHSASVRRLARALSLGIWIWLGALLMDVWITQVTGEGDLPYFLVMRALGTASIGLILWRLRRDPEPSPRLLWWLDATVFTVVSVIISLICIRFRGVECPYAVAVVAILVARGATTLGPWQRGAWLFGFPALAYPCTMLAGAAFNPLIAAQLQEPRATNTFVCLVFVLIECWVMLTVGGHFAWRLRREALETRSIGRYKLERRLGSGGMGDVWAAFDMTLKQRVALKTVKGHLPGSQSLGRLEREVRALAELTHPNTVRVFDYGVTEDGLWYYAMELLHGMTLRELVSRDGPMQPDRLLQIGRQVLRALGEAHRKGIIHRDIKPENVFVAELGGESDVAKLLDFGIAKATVSGEATLTNTGHVAGTPAYMAPELIVGRPADVRSDIYAFGAMLYFGLTARLPFSEADRAALFAAHLYQQPEPPSSVRGTAISSELESVVQRCMAKDPGQRYPSTQALLEALHPGIAPAAVE